MLHNFSCIIVDDELDAIALLSSRLAKLYNNILVTGTYQRWEKAYEALQEQHCDLLFMDISMPGKNGIELLRLLPDFDSEIIFVTAYENFAIDAFAFSTSGYILKPIEDATLSLSINKAIDRIQNKRLAKKASTPVAYTSNKIGIPNNHGFDYVNIDDILYLESTNKCTKIVTAKTEYTSSNHLGKFKSLLDNHSFYQVHRTYIVNLNNILRYESSGLVIMSNKKEIPVARSIKNDFLKIFNSEL